MERPSVIVGIHGLANKPPVDEKTRWWREAIAEGLARNEGLAEAAFAFAFVYWADLRYETPLAGDAIDEPYRRQDDAGPLPAEADAPRLTGQDVLATLYAGIDRVEALTGLTLVDDVILEHRFDDLWHYHGERAFAAEVRARLNERLARFRDHRILLVAHSMGSVIAHDALRLLERDAPGLRIDHLVTVGSPLGLAKVKMKIETEFGAARVPNNVGRWTNLADGNDIVTVTGTLAEDFAPSDTGVIIDDRRVVNDYHRPTGEANHHKSYGYLRTPEFSQIARGFLEAGGQGPAPEKTVAARTLPQSMAHSDPNDTA